MSPFTVDLIGYVGSALVVLSFTMRRIVPLRIISMTAAVIVCVYGVLIHAWPVIITNAVIVVIHSVYLYREITRSHEFDLVPIASDSPFLVDFLSGHLTDIQRSQPDFVEPLPQDLAFIYMRDGMPAGVLVGGLNLDRLNVRLDYVLPAFRDSLLATWLYERDGGRRLKAAGIREVAERAGTDMHRRYLEGVGFVHEGDRFVRTL
jgi:hypothetical protein